MGQNKLITLLACTYAGLFWGCVSQRDHQCTPLPQLPKTTSPRIVRAGPVELNFGDTDGWDVSIGYGRIAMLDSGHFEGRQIHVEVDTFRLPGYSDQAAMDTIRLDLEREIVSDRDITYSKSQIYCDQKDDRISVIEYRFDSDEQNEYQYMIVSHRFLDGLGVQIRSGSTVPRHVGAAPLDMRERVLMWMSAIRVVEK